jgi:hypothetical protein
MANNGLAHQTIFRVHGEEVSFLDMVAWSEQLIASSVALCEENQALRAEATLQRNRIQIRQAVKRGKQTWTAKPRIGSSSPC